jgi:hypothetical protein
MPGATHSRDLFDRIGQDFRFCQPLVGELVDEARIGPVLEQPADKVREQVAMPTDRCIDTAMIALLADQSLVQPLAHAVKPLELEVAIAACPFEQGRHRQRVVAGEGRADILGVEHIARHREIRNVGRRLAREQWIVRQPFDLGALDFAIPIGALDQPHVHQPIEVVGPVDHQAGALAIGLHRHAEPVPALQAGQRRDGADDVEAHLEPLAFLGIDGQRDPLASRLHRQRFEHRGQLGDAAIVLRDFVARVERRQLDRDGMTGGWIAPDGVDRIGIGVEIARGVLDRPRRFAQHVEARGEAPVLGLLHPIHRLGDGAAHDENFAHHPHRRADRLTHERFAGAADQPAQRTALAFADQRAADHQPPGRDIDQGRVGLARMRAPIGIAQFVGDQQIGGLGVGHAQERLGQREQRHAFGRVQPIFLQELVYPALGLRRAQIRQQSTGMAQHPSARFGSQRGAVQKRF